jgi:outer membrane protein assembly factor BamB
MMQTMKLLSLALLTAVTATTPSYNHQNVGHYDYSQQQQQPALPNAPISVESTLPPPWQEHFDPSSKRAYYYNPDSGVTQWERPPLTKEETPSSRENVAGDLDPFSNAFAQGGDGEVRAAGDSKEERRDENEKRALVAREYYYYYPTLVVKLPVT